MDNSSGVGVLDKAALVLGALEAGPADPGRPGHGHRPGPPDRPPARRRPRAPPPRRPRHAGPLRPRPAPGRARRRRRRGPPARRRRPGARRAARHHRRERPAVPPPGRAPRLRRRRRAPVRPARHDPGRLAADDARRLGRPGAARLGGARSGMHRGLQGAAFTATALSGVRRRGWAQTRRRARAGRGLGVRAGPLPRRQGHRRRVGLRPDRAALPPARPDARRRRRSPAPTSSPRCSPGTPPSRTCRTTPDPASHCCDSHRSGPPGPAARGYPQ